MIHFHLVCIGKMRNVPVVKIILFRYIENYVRKISSKSIQNITFTIIKYKGHIWIQPSFVGMLTIWEKTKRRIIIANDTPFLIHLLIKVDIRRYSGISPLILSQILAIGLAIGFRFFESQG